MLYLKLQQTFNSSQNNYELELGQSVVLVEKKLCVTLKATSGLELISRQLN